MESFKVIPLDDLEEKESLLEERIVYTVNGKLHVGRVIARSGGIILTRREPFDKKDRIHINSVMGVVEKSKEGADE